MTKFLDLDSLPTGNERVLKLNGKEHALKAMSVADFIENTRLIQAQGDTPALDKEFEVMIALIQRGFPSVTTEELMALTLPQLNKILEFVQSSDAPDEAETKGDAANPPAAAK